MGFRIVTLALVALGIFLIVENRIVSGSAVLLVAAAVTWLIGLWVAPWGVESYSRKQSNIMREWLTDLQDVDEWGVDGTGIIQRSLSRCIERTQKLKPSADLKTEHDLHLEALRKYCLALDNYVDANRNGDTEAIHIAKETALESHQNLDRISQALSAKLKATWIESK